jgi:predicted HicB family RNase H-like nuclease
MDLQAMSVRMPPDLHEQLRLAAFEHRISMNTLACEGIELRLAELKAAATEDQP